MLIGKRVRLRALERADLPLVVAWFNDPALRALVARSTPMSMAEEERFFEGLQRSQNDVVMIIETRPDAQDATRSVGLCGLHRIDWRNRNASIGILLGDVDDRGHGLGSEALTLLVRHAFDDLGLHRVELEVFSDNTRARRSYDKVGFVTEGTRREASFKQGRFVDLVVMSMLAGRDPQAVAKPRRRARSSQASARAR